MSYNAAMSKPVLFLGDTSLDTAASYLAGALSHAGWEFDYLPSDAPLQENDLAAARKLIIISDYPAERIENLLQQKVVTQVQQGTGLLMIGGWESYQGSGGNWAGTPIGNLLPVRISEADDRQNCDQPVFVRCETEHPISTGLPWNERPPIIGGYNRVEVAAQGSVILRAQRYSASFKDNQTECHLVRGETDPLLVVDDSRAGRVAALMTDLAPHWVGPLVDWGSERVSAHASGAEEIEVGHLYIKFIRQLVAWVGRLEG